MGEGLLEVAAQQSAAHGRAGAVDHPQQAALFLAAPHGLHQLEVAPGRGVKAHKASAGVDIQLHKAIGALHLGVGYVTKQASQRLGSQRLIGKP